MGQRPRTLDPSASPRAFFGAQLRHWREYRGLSQDELGRLVHVSGDLVGKLEKAQRRGVPELVARLDEALAAGGVLVEATNAAQAYETVRQDERRRTPCYWGSADPDTSADTPGGGTPLAAVLPAPTRASAPGSGSGSGFGPGPAPGALVEAANVSGEESAALLARLESSNVGPATIEYLQAELVSIARAYVHAPLLPLFVRMLAVRAQVVRLLDGVQPLGQRRDLLVVTGATLGLLAHACEDLGLGQTAVTHARAGAECARQAGHRELRAWIAGTLSGILDLSGDHAAAAELASQAGADAGADGQRCRLAALEARAWAHLGAAGPTRAALAVANDATADAGGELDTWGGVFTFPEAKHRFYAGNSLLWLGRGSDAICESTAAIAVYESGPPAVRSYGDAACARADIVAAHVRAGDITAAREALQPLIELSPEQRVAGLATHLAVAGRDLNRFTDRTPVADLRELIRLALPASPVGAGL